MKTPRSAGILLHPTSLPGDDGIGTFGRHARTFIDRLAEAGQSWWQVLPLNPTGPGGSPYSATSSFALNPMLIDLDALADLGWLTRPELDAYFAARAPSSAGVDFGDVEHHKAQMLRVACQRWRQQGGHRRALEAFVRHEAHWLDDFALYSALKRAHDSRSWRDWPAPLARRQPDALDRARADHAEAIEQAQFEQWIAHRQWADLCAYARERHVGFIGDIPIFVAMDSAEVWAHRELFELDPSGHADVVSGVPPDYFSPSGQKWGNPLYDWPALTARGFSWWIARVEKALAGIDLVRLDHFRGFEAYWEVPADAPDAVDGRWCPGPRDALFDAIRDALGDVPFIAEDLGMITDEVRQLRERQGLPGMKILQFAFNSDPDHPFLPHTYPERCVAYTGTHDNDTTLGWWATLDARSRRQVLDYHACDEGQLLWAMIDDLFDSQAMLTILPAQDLFGLDTHARMNLPGSPDGNWTWRMQPSMLLPNDHWERLHHATDASDRLHTHGTPQ